MSRPFVWPTVKYGERVTIVGPTGCGKTTVKKAILKTFGNTITVDTKRTEDWSDVGESLSTKEIYRVRGGRWIYRVPGAFLTNPALVEQFFTWALARRNCVIDVDEQLHVPPTHAEMILATQGRANKVSLMVGTQRPMGVPLYSISEAEHTFVFNLRLKRDRERMEEITNGAKIPWTEMVDPRKRNDDDPDHSFVYINRNGSIFGPTFLNISEG